MEVPLNAVYYVSVGGLMVEPLANAATIPTPGAEISGLIAPSPRGPRLEKGAIASFRSTAATESAASAVLGELTEPALTELPAATTNNVPFRSVSSLIACSS